MGRIKYNPDIHHRRSIRLKGYDYSRAGLYFITICTHDNVCLFGKIKNGEMVLNHAGRMVKTVWNEIPDFYEQFDVHQFVVMPNHFHGIIEIVSIPKSVGAGPCACPNNVHLSHDGQSIKGQPQGVAPTMSLFDIVRRFKTLTTKRYIDGVKKNNWTRISTKLWHRNYYEHIIRDEKSYVQISEYIQTNPLKWKDDKYYVLI